MEVLQINQKMPNINIYNLVWIVTQVERLKSSILVLINKHQIKTTFDF